MAGRKPKKPPKNAAEKIEKWAAGGSPVRAIARGLGVALETMNKWLEEYPELRDAMDAGRDAEHQMLRDALIKQLDKSPVAAIFLLKTRHGYREGDQGELANRVTINFQLPGAAKTVKEYRQVIEHETAPSTDD